MTSCSYTVSRYLGKGSIIALTCADGFMLPASSDDGILLDEAITRHLKLDQQAVLRDVGYMGNFTLTASTREVCFRTQVAVRSVLLTANEWEHYMGSGEDLAEDKEHDVRAWLVAPLTEFLQECVVMKQRLQDLQMNEDDELVKTKLGLIEGRWTEIELALKAWLKVDDD